MSVSISLIDDPRLTARRIVPIRFARAVTDTFADPDAPDLDDHGFTAPNTFGSGHGPVVGVIQGKTVRVLVVREFLDDSAGLYVTSDDASIASVEYPPSGQPLGTTDVAASGTDPARPANSVFIHGAATGSADRMTTVKIRFGSATGPVLAELSVRVYQILVISVQVHLISIGVTAASAVAPIADLAAATSLFSDVNKVYAQAGIRFDLLADALPDTVTGFARDGTVTLTATRDDRNTELQTVLNQRPTPDVLNAYFIGHYFDVTLPAASALDQTLGIAFSRDSANGSPPNGAFPGCQAGITVRDSTDPIEAAHTVAHEIGHALTLEHHGRGNPPERREDIWAHRCLMYNIVGLSSSDDPTEPTPNRFHNSVARTSVGYGDLASGVPSTGQLIMTKDITGIPQSSQVDLVRSAFASKSFAPVTRP